MVPAPLHTVRLLPQPVCRSQCLRGPVHRLVPRQFRFTDHWPPFTGPGVLFAIAGIPYGFAGPPFTAPGKPRTGSEAASATPRAAYCFAQPPSTGWEGGFRYPGGTVRFCTATVHYSRGTVHCPWETIYPAGATKQGRPSSVRWPRFRKRVCGIIVYKDRDFRSVALRTQTAERGLRLRCPANHPVDRSR